ncbi:hypothetical protein [Polaromonas sp. JS666]|uniref:hypothetical protein n=1 Tax=Polaromonas sp. (strain JS666 / ATCC BAA-500) TaxID=296591 RepID=UPI0008811341|nr:hypothetical protein [Polaromonas sp. JS666]SDO13661.1 hypothetical protein SAMN05720382_11518 [Polaromonas sp. JS666]
MSFLNWFSSKPSPVKPSPAEEQRRASAARDKSPLSVPGRLPVEAAAPGDGAKLKRHARREQLYVAIRESMTRSGVLSASYKFKVLSLDQRGNEFLVMMDLAKAFGRPSEQLGEIETLIIQNAKARFEITVPAVYWRIDETAVVVKPKPSTQDAPQSAAVPVAAAAAVVPAVPDAAAKPAKPPTPRYEPIQADEVAAFKQALLAASAQGPAAAPEKGVKDAKEAREVKEAKEAARSKGGPRSYALLTGFEDTEMPDSPSSPALSSTQYGDLV